MSDNALIAVGVVVVVPIDKAGRFAGGQLQGEHRDGAGDIHFAGAWFAGFAHHTHREAGAAAVVELDARPALDGASDALGCRHPVVDCDGEFCVVQNFIIADEFGDCAVRLYRGDFLFHLCRFIGKSVCGSEDFREVNGDNFNAGCLEEFFAETDGMERFGACADCADSCVAKAPDDAADCGESLDVGGEFVAFDGAGVQFCICEGYAVLTEVVADGEFSAEGVAAMVEVHFFHYIVAGLDEDGDIEVGQGNGLHDGLLVAEVGQYDNDAVDFVSGFTEEFGADFCILICFDGAAFCSVLRDDDAAEPHFSELVNDCLSSVNRQRGGEKAPC